MLLVAELLQGQEEWPDGYSRCEAGVHRHLLPPMSAVSTSLAGADSKNYLAGLAPPFVPTVTHNGVLSA